MSNTDKFTRSWITENALEICRDYEWGILTLRGLHYQLVGLGMTNSIQHYKRVVSAMIVARRAGKISYEQFSDHDREMIGKTRWQETDVDTKIKEARHQIKLWMESYSKNRWENQDCYLEVWIEKKALQGVFEPVCKRNALALCPCKGYPSLTFLSDAATRFIEAEESGKNCVIVYFGDHDPSGEDIPRSLSANFRDDFNIEVKVDRRALTRSQCKDLKLPPAPAKKGDSRTDAFLERGGLGQIELDAVKPEMLQTWCQEAIDDYFDYPLSDELDDAETIEREVYQSALKKFVTTL